MTDQLNNRIAEAEVQLPKGRIGWPSIVEYLTEDGSFCSLPPNSQSMPAPVGRWQTPSSVDFETIIHDPAIYEHLKSTGRIYLPSHTGVHGTLIDNRKTS
jgi:hypothetical protein